MRFLKGHENHPPFFTKYNTMKFDKEKDIKRLLIVCCAAVLMAVNIKTFVRTGGLYPGGATGLTILVQRAAKLIFDVDLPYTLISVLFNAVPVYIGFRYIGKNLRCSPV